MSSMVYWALCRKQYVKVYDQHSQVTKNDCYFNASLFSLHLRYIKKQHNKKSSWTQSFMHTCKILSHHGEDPLLTKSDHIPIQCTPKQGHTWLYTIQFKYYVQFLKCQESPQKYVRYTRVFWKSLPYVFKHKFWVFESWKTSLILTMDVFTSTNVL